MVPIYKGKGEGSECENYRGIGLHRIPCKEFGRVLMERIQKGDRMENGRRAVWVLEGKKVCDEWIEGQCVMCCKCMLGMVCLAGQ